MRAPHCVLCAMEVSLAACMHPICMGMRCLVARVVGVVVCDLWCVAAGSCNAWGMTMFTLGG